MSGGHQRAKSTDVLATRLSLHNPAHGEVLRAQKGTNKCQRGRAESIVNSVYSMLHAKYLHTQGVKSTYAETSINYVNATKQAFWLGMLGWPSAAKRSRKVFGAHATEESEAAVLGEQCRCLTLYKL